jgi:chromatin segregation and condensation protein Rec8/ScpA/Scc1 (kleisin family)
MKPLRFTQHALEKLELLRQWGFAFDQERIIDHMAEPHAVASGYRGRFVASLKLDEEHVLRVVYEEDGEVVVITIYPARQGRYED